MRLILAAILAAATLSTSAGNPTAEIAQPIATPDASAAFCQGIEASLDELTYDPAAASQLPAFPSVQTFCVLRYLER